MHFPSVSNTSWYPNGPKELCYNQPYRLPAPARRKHCVKFLCGKRVIKLSLIDLPVFLFAILTLFGGIFTRSSSSAKKMLLMICFMMAYFVIKEWWESGDDVTLINRPRRFGKTLNMSMLEQFFSVDYAASLIAKGIHAEHIRKYGFAFEGKKVLIG